jgi:UDP-glucose 4-epimerase
MRVLIVGGAGFLGSGLARSLRARGWQPHVYDTVERLATAGALLDGVPTTPFDFARDAIAPALFAGGEALVHLACTTHPAMSMDAMAFDAESNIAPSVRLFDAAQAAGVRRVVFSSSGGTVYGAPQRLPVAESDPTRPLSAYGVSKVAIESYLALYPSLRGVSLRVANPYGPYQLAGTAVGVIARYVATVARREPIEVWGDGSVVRDYVAVADVVEAFVRALSTPDLAPGPYNVGSGRGASVSQIVDAVFAAAGYTVPVVRKPGRPYDVPEIVLDSRAFQAATGWSPTIGLDAGIAELMQRARARLESHAGPQHAQ